MVSLSNHVAISLRFSTCRGTIIATATSLPRCARNDMRKTERPCSQQPAQSYFDYCFPATPAPRFRHSRESGNPVPQIASFVADAFILWPLDSRRRGDDGRVISHCDPVLEYGGGNPVANHTQKSRPSRPSRQNPSPTPLILSQ